MPGWLAVVLILFVFLAGALVAGVFTYIWLIMAFSGNAKSTHAKSTHAKRSK